MSDDLLMKASDQRITAVDVSVQWQVVDNRQSVHLLAQFGYLPACGVLYVHLSSFGAHKDKTPQT